MAIDDKDFAHTIVQLLRKILDLETTVAAMGLVLTERDADFERAVGMHRTALLARAAPLLAAFERADAADLLEMLKRFNGPVQ